MPQGQYRPEDVSAPARGQFSQADLAPSPGDAPNPYKQEIDRMFNPRPNPQAATSFLPMVATMAARGGPLVSGAVGAGASLVRSAVDDKPETLTDALWTAGREGLVQSGAGAAMKGAQMASGPIKAGANWLWRTAQGGTASKTTGDAVLSRGMGYLSPSNLKKIETPRTPTGGYASRQFTPAQVEQFREGVDNAKGQMSRAVNIPAQVVSGLMNRKLWSGAAQGGYSAGRGMKKAAPYLPDAVRVTAGLSDAAKRQAMIELFGQDPVASH